MHTRTKSPAVCIFSLGYSLHASYASNGKFFISSSRDQTVKVWESATGKLLSTLSGHSLGVWACDISPDGTKVVSVAWDKLVKLWDWKAGKELRCFAGHTERINSCAFSPDGMHIVSGSEDNTIRQWSVDAGGTEVTKFLGRFK